MRSLVLESSDGLPCEHEGRQRQQLSDILTKLTKFYVPVMTTNPVVMLGNLGRDLETGSFDGPGEQFWQGVALSMLKYCQPDAASILKSALSVFDERMDRVMQERAELKEMHASLSIASIRVDVSPPAGPTGGHQRLASTLGSSQQHPSSELATLQMSHPQRSFMHHLLNHSNKSRASSSGSSALAQTRPAHDLQTDLQLQDNLLVQLQRNFSAEALERMLLYKSALQALQPEFLVLSIPICYPYLLDMVAASRSLAKVL